MLRTVAVVIAAVFALSMAAHAVPAWGRRTGAAARPAIGV